MEAISRIVRSAFCAYAQEQTPQAACVFADGESQKVCAETDWRVWREAATPEGRSG